MAWVFICYSPAMGSRAEARSYNGRQPCKSEPRLANTTSGDEMSEGIAHGRDLRRGRVSEPGRIYLITTVTHDRRPVFADFAAARVVVGCLRRMDETACCETLCFVVMPDHVHWLLLLGEHKPLSGLVQIFKNLSARRVNATRGESGPLWQAGFHDHALRAEEDVLEVARYVVANPVRAALVARVGGYSHWDARWI